MKNLLGWGILTSPAIVICGVVAYQQGIFKGLIALGAISGTLAAIALGTKILLENSK